MYYTHPHYIHIKTNADADTDVSMMTNCGCRSGCGSQILADAPWMQRSGPSQLYCREGAVGCKQFHLNVQ